MKNSQQPVPRRVSDAWFAVPLLTVAVLLIHGYHPYSEDGGLYVAGIKKVLNPALYPAWSEFVTEHLRFSVFAPLVAGLVRGLHVPLPGMLLVLYLLSTAATLLAGFLLVSRCVPDRAARLTGVALLACWMALPIAGTSLLLADPYLTARSLSTPLVLLALVFALDACTGRRLAWFAGAAALVLAAALHPLMAGYGLATVAVMAALAQATPRRRLGGLGVLALAGLALASVLQARAPAESAGYLRIALTRYYWFPGQWHWYEQLGLVAPLMVLLWLTRKAKERELSACELSADGYSSRPAGLLARTALAIGLLGLLVAVLFSHGGFQTHLVARLQPLRTFQVVYVVMILLLGAWLGQRLRKLWTGALLVVLAAVMFAASRSTYANSDHLELPWTSPRNAWEQAFLWIRENTPPDATVAMNAHYITEGHGEDAQCFRALAERSALPDYSKDGGVASLDPALTTEWMRGEQAQERLETRTDAERVRSIARLGATWAILDSSSGTAWNCPYRNTRVKVCAVPFH